MDLSPRSEITTPEVLGDDETAERPRVRWRAVALGVAAGMPAVALLCVFAEHADLVFRVVKVVAGISALAATVLTLRFVELPPASAAFLAAADPTRPLDESLASSGAALAPDAASPTTEPLSASPTLEPPTAPALKPADTVPARKLIGQLLFRRELPPASAQFRELADLSRPLTPHDPLAAAQPPSGSIEAGSRSGS